MQLLGCGVLAWYSLLVVVFSLDIVSGEPRRTRDLINRQYYWPFLPLSADPFGSFGSEDCIISIVHSGLPALLDNEN